jgi:hypothetical protein
MKMENLSHTFGTGTVKMEYKKFGAWLRRKGFKPWDELTEEQKKDWKKDGHPTVHKNDELGWYRVTKDGSVEKFGNGKERV